MIDMRTIVEGLGGTLDTQTGTPIFAVILAGLAEAPFFIAIYVFYEKCSPKWLLLIGLLAGLTNGLAVSMTGVNPLHLAGGIGAHVTWSYVIFFSLIPVFVAFGLALWRVKGVSRTIALLGFAACAIDIFFLATLLSGQIGAGLGSIMEWFSVVSYIAWIALISLDVLARSRAGTMIPNRQVCSGQQSYTDE